MTLNEIKAAAEAVLALNEEDWPIYEAGLRKSVQRIPALCEALEVAIESIKAFEKFFGQEAMTGSDTTLDCIAKILEKK